MNKHLIVFTAEYPFGYGETYLENEITYLAASFESVLIVSNAADLTRQRAVPGNVTLLVRPYGLSSLSKFLSFRYLFSPAFLREVAVVLLTYRMSLNRVIISTSLQTIAKSFALEKFLHDKINGRSLLPETVCYSYWADDNAASLALLKSRGYTFKAICRAHRWDVYFDKNGSGYLPFRKLMADRLDAYLFISKNGLDYFKQKVKCVNSRLQVARLGVLPIATQAGKENSYEYHLLSCSGVISRKRVHKIAEALTNMNNALKVRWTHIGSGEEFENLQAICNRLLGPGHNVTYHLAGNLSNEEVRTFYSLNHIDLFINVSESEGVPVSIMEALSAGIPAIATDVDGNGEVVLDSYNGFLIRKNFHAPDLAQVIENYLLKTKEEKLQFRENAMAHYLNFYSAEKNYSAFVALLKEL